MIERRFKVVFVGPHAAGKTSIIHRFVKDNVSEPLTTVGVAFYSRDVIVDDRKVTLNIWDTAGMERYKSLVPKYQKGAAAAIIVFSLADPASFAAATSTLINVPHICDSNVVTFFVGNKFDLEHAIDVRDARQIAEAHNSVFLETSAKTGEGVTELFDQVASRVAFNCAVTVRVDGTLTAISEQKTAPVWCC
jgi:small GTP-binding protein